MGVRVYELARTLGRSSKDLMHELKKQGIDLKSHMSSIDEETAELVAELLKATPPPSVKEMLVALPVVEEEERKALPNHPQHIPNGYDAGDSGTSCLRRQRQW